MKTNNLWKGLLAIVLGVIMTACQKDDNEPMKIISTQEVVREGKVIVEASYQNELKKMYFILVSPNTAVVTRATDFNPELVNRQYYGKEVIPSEFTHLGQSYTVVGINDGAFNGCNKLTSVVMPNTVTTIGRYVFMECTVLKNITFSNTLESIGYESFVQCSQITSMDFPASLQEFWTDVFKDCSSMTSMTCRATTPPHIIGSTWEMNDQIIQEIKVPQASVEAYKAAPVWSIFADRIVGY